MARVYIINTVSNCPYTQGFEIPIVGTHTQKRVYDYIFRYDSLGKILRVIDYSLGKVYTIVVNSLGKV